MSNLPDFKTRQKTRELLRDKDGKLNVLSYILSIIGVVIFVNIMLYIPTTLVGTEWEWITIKINESHTWKTIYALVFVIVLFLVFGVIISIYEYLEDKLGF